MSIKLMLMSKYKPLWRPKAQTALAPNPAQAVTVTMATASKAEIVCLFF